MQHEVFRELAQPSARRVLVSWDILRRECRIGNIHRRICGFLLHHVCNRADRDSSRRCLRKSDQLD